MWQEIQPKLSNILFDKPQKNNKIMAIIKTVEGKTPHWGKNCFIAENAALTGDCVLGDDCSIWYSAVLRSDVDAIRCGNRVNVQDCACIHQTGTMPCILEDDVSVGHGAVVHGAIVHKGALTRTGRGICKALCWIHQGLVFEGGVTG